MQLTEEPFDEMRDLFPKPRGHVRWDHRRVAERYSLQQFPVNEKTLS